MSNIVDEERVMPPQISPKDIPRGGENSDSEEDEPVPPVIVENSSSSDDDADNMEDEDADVNLGYVQLAQDEGNSEETTNQWPSHAEEASEADSESVADNAASNSSSTPTRSADADMKQEQVDLIRQVMVGITLPSSAIPEWAKVVPEEKWKASLVSSITNRTAPPDSGKKD